MPEKSSFCLRKFAGALTLCAVGMLAVAAVVLYLAPSCSVANATGWSFLGIGKDSWEAVSALACGLVLLGGAACLVSYRSRLSGYLTGRKRLAGEWLAAIALCCAFAAAVVAEVAPLSCIGRWHEVHQHSGAGSGAHGGCKCGERGDSRNGTCAELATRHCNDDETDIPQEIHSGSEARMSPEVESDKKPGQTDR